MVSVFESSGIPITFTYVTEYIGHGCVEMCTYRAYVESAVYRLCLNKEKG